MKIGLLLCDHVAVDLRVEFGDYPSMFQDLLSFANIITFDCTQQQFPPHFAGFDAFVCSGSVHSVYEDLPWIKTLAGTIRGMHRKRVPFVGVCFGHQMLAQALGGMVEPFSGGWCIGAHAFHVHHQEPWMQPPASQIRLLMSCQDQVTKLPAGSTLLASGACCENGMFQVSDCMLGIQAHPEFSKEYSRTLIERRRDRIGDDIVKGGLASLDAEINPHIILQWIKTFIGRHEPKIASTT